MEKVSNPVSIYELWSGPSSSDSPLPSIVDNIFLDSEQQRNEQLRCSAEFCLLCSARSPFFNIMNSSFSLNRAYCLSVRSFTNCKMSLILLLGLDNRYLLKVKSHQFSILHNIKHNLHWISLTLHQKKLFPNTYYAWKKK